VATRGSKPGVKRGPYQKHKPRKYPTLQKTTTPEGKKEYQRYYMRDKLDISPNRFWKIGRKPKERGLQNA